MRRSPRPTTAASSISSTRRWVPKPAKITNGGTADLSALKLGFQLINSKSAYAFFGDGRGDADHDDMTLRIDVAPVPVPAGLLLMGTALAGLGLARRKA